MEDLDRGDIISLYVNNNNHFISNNIIKSLIHTIFVRNPCKKCLVIACCSKLCNDKKKYLKYCDVNGNIAFNRFLVLMIWYGAISLLIILIKIIVQ